jgi:hypothetical protein
VFDAPFERRLRQENLLVRYVRAPAHPGAKAYHCCIWLAEPAGTRGTPIAQPGRQTTGAPGRTRPGWRLRDRRRGS